MSLRSYVRGVLDPSAPMWVPQRYRHDDPGCSVGKDQCLIVTRVPAGYQYYCHRCGRGGTLTLHGMSPRETLALLRARRDAPSLEAKRQVHLPYDFTTEIPAPGLAWLYKYRISPKEIEQYGIGYSKREGRVILPVYEQGNLIYWQGRYIGDHKQDGVAKYRNQKAMGRNDLYFRNLTTTSPDVILVEDIISAIVVGRVTSCIALLYAYVPVDLIRQLVGEYETVWIWLDPDKAAYTAKMLGRCRSLGLPVRRIYTDNDPKCYGEEEIEEKIA